METRHQAVTVRQRIALRLAIMEYPTSSADANIRRGPRTQYQFPPYWTVMEMIAPPGATISESTAALLVSEPALLVTTTV